MKPLLFEGKKLIRTKVFPTFLLVTILFITGVFIWNVFQQDAIQANKVAYFFEISKEVSSQNMSDREELKDSPNPDLEKKLQVGGSLSAQLKQLIQEIQNKNWKEELTVEIGAYKTAMEYLEFHGARFGVSRSEMEKTIHLNEELLIRNLPKEDFDLSIQTSIFMKKILSLIMNPVGFILLLFVLGPMITREFEENNMKMVYALPIPKVQYLLIKFISLLVASLLWVATVFLLSFLLPNFFGHAEGDIFNYPLFTNEGNFVSSGDYLKMAMVYSIGFTAFAISLLVFLGFMTRNTILTYLITLLVLIGGWIVSDNGIHSIANPLSYQTIDFAILHTASYYPMGTIVLVGTMILLLILTFLINRKRGI